MKHNDEIKDLFKRNAHKLDEMPAVNVWERLEKKLDEPKPKKSPGIFRYLLVAASVMLLVASIPLLSRIFGKQSKSEIALAASNKMTPVFFEDLDTDDESYADYYRVVEYQRKYKDRMKKPIVEGSKNRKLYATQNLEDFKDVAVQEKPVPPKKYIPTPVKKTRQEFNIEIGIVPEMEIAAANDADLASVDLENGNENIPAAIENIELGIPAAPANNHAAGIEADGAMRQATEDVVLAEPVPYIPADEVYAAEEAVVASSYSAKKKSNAPAADVPQTEIRANNVTNTASLPENTAGIHSFQWMIGEWQGNHNNGFTKESWQQKDSNTLEGSGTYALNGTTLFSENLKLEFINGEVFYTIGFENTNEPVKFRLVQTKNNRAVFEPIKQGAYKKMVLTKTKSGHFTTEFKLKKSNSHNDLTRQYLQQRNHVKNKEAMRTLEKM